jgi:predicted transcriptional regulator
MAEKVKFSVSVSAELGAALRECAEADDVQLSTVVSRALERYLDDRRRIRAGLAEMDQYEMEYGPFSGQEMTEADAWVDGLFGRPDQERRTA